MNGETLVAILAGFGLAAACGFRVFIPLLVASAAAHFGYYAPTPGFEWIGSTPALIVFAVATVIEIAGYNIPWLDHALDVAGSPAAIVAGSLLMASSITGMPPYLHAALAIIAGGGAAGLLHAATGVSRIASSLTTGGIGNPVLAMLEAAGSLVISLASVFVPILALGILALFLAGIAIALTVRRKASPASLPRRR